MLIFFKRLGCSSVCRLALPEAPMAAFSLDRAAPLAPQDASTGSVAQPAFENAGARVASSTTVLVPVLLAPNEIVGERYLAKRRAHGSATGAHSTAMGERRPSLDGRKIGP